MDMYTMLEQNAKALGVENCLTQCMEECAELIQACNKLLRASGKGLPTEVEPGDALTNLLEETVDVSVMMAEHLMYESATYEVILQRMLDRVSNKLDKRPGAVIWDTHSQTAIEFQVLYIELDQIYKETFGDTASREYLIKRAKERGLSPYPASCAVLRG